MHPRNSDSRVVPAFAREPHADDASTAHRDDTLACHLTPHVTYHLNGEYLKPAQMQPGCYLH